MPTRGRGELRYCPAGCGRVVRAGALLCPADWRRVPDVQRRAVNAAWRRWTADMTDAAWDAYLADRAAALTAIGVAP